MELFVRFRAFESINEPEAVQRLRQRVGERMQRLEKSGNLVESRVFSDARGGFILIEADNGTEVQDLLGPELLDHFHIETHPTTSMEDLAAFFEREGPS